jgi:membrane protein required for colicin V production
MEPYDICMLVVLVGTTLFGAWKGMAWQAASSASLVVSYAVALKLSPQFAGYFGQQAPLNRFIAMFVLYMVTSLAIWMAFRLVARFIDRVRLREFDRQMGALLGAAKGVMWCVAITFFAVTLSTRARSAVLSSRSGYYIARLLDRADAVMPKELHQVLDPYLHTLEHHLDPTTNPPPPSSQPAPAQERAQQGSRTAPICGGVRCSLLRHACRPSRAACV